MPLYEYECQTCQKVLEIIQKFSDAPLTECPQCKGPIRKLISRTSFQLKGSGWYATDYKASSSSSSSQAGQEAKTSPKPVDSSSSTSSSGCGSSTCGSGKNGNSKT